MAFAIEICGSTSPWRNAVNQLNTMDDTFETSIVDADVWIDWHYGCFNQVLDYIYDNTCSG